MQYGQRVIVILCASAPHNGYPTYHPLSGTRGLFGFPVDTGVVPFDSDQGIQIPAGRGSAQLTLLRR